MHLRLVSWVFITWNLVEYVGSQQPSRVRRQGRMHPNGSQACQGGCATCSDYNGCMSCKPRLFLALERIGMKQLGVCLPSCPSGYFGKRTPEINECIKCKPAECDACFAIDFCTKCKNGFYLHLGKCLEKCPEWLEPNNHTMECDDILHCRITEWSPWSPCTKKGKTCGFKRGNETRVREILQLPSTKGNPCSHTNETRKCIVRKKKCHRTEKGRRNREERRKKPKSEESKENRQESRSRESRRQNREQRENKRRIQLKKKRLQVKMQRPTPSSTVH